jgi:hypothetical protein
MRRFLSSAEVTPDCKRASDGGSFAEARRMVESESSAKRKSQVVRLGSKAALTASKWDFCYTLESRLNSDIQAKALPLLF